MPTILEQELASGKLYSLLPPYRRLRANALRDVAGFIRRCGGRCYNSLSWGKQSIVLAHMIYKVDPSIKQVFWGGPDMELIADFAATRDAFIKKWPINYEGFSAGDTDLKKNGINYLIEHDLKGVFMGLAKCESKGRRRTLEMARAGNIFSYVNKRLRCCPLADWDEHALAAYIASNGIPLLSTYRRFGLTARTSAGITPGSHAEVGIDLLCGSGQAEIRRRWKIKSGGK